MQFSNPGLDQGQRNSDLTPPNLTFCGSNLNLTQIWPIFSNPGSDPRNLVRWCQKSELNSRNKPKFDPKKFTPVKICILYKARLLRIKNFDQNFKNK